MIWTSVKDFIGDLWGKATTVSLGIGVAVMAVPLPADTAVPLWLRWALFGIALGVAVLRQIAPPPPSVTIRKEDGVQVNRNTGTVTVSKAEGVPEGMSSKPAGTY